MRHVKLRGERSLESKLHRLAYELEDDGRRVRSDYPQYDSLADALFAISSQLGDLSRGLHHHGVPDEP